MEILKTSTNYQETLKADFYEKFSFLDKMRNNLVIWEKENFEKIMMEGIQSGEFNVGKEKKILPELTIMILHGLEIPFFIQEKYQEYSQYYDNLINIILKGLSK